MPRLIVTCLLLLATLPAAALDWDYLALDGKILHAIQRDDARERVFVGTEEGFHYLDEATGEWTNRDWEGWIGRAVYAFGFHDELPGRVITGRRNAWFKGYIEYSDDLGVSEHFVYESQGGHFTAMCRDATHHYGCTWSDIAPGEFVRSADGGVSWQVRTGHGHFNLTDLAIDFNYALLLGGDNGVTRSWDNGQTWEPLSGLPAGYGVYCLATTHPGGSAWPETFVYAGNDLGLYLCQSPGYWEQLLDVGVTRIACHEQPIGLIAAITLDERVLLSRDWGHTWHDETGNLPVGATLRDILYSDHDRALYVATLDGGVWRATQVNTGAPDTPAPARASLAAHPNPFNPRTAVVFELPAAGRVTIDIFDIRGRQVTRLLDEARASGSHTVDWDASGLAGGVYLARLGGDFGDATTRLVLLK